MSHSIKVTGDQCTINLGSGMTTPVTTYVTSSEKQGCSAVYTKASPCPAGVNPSQIGINLAAPQLNQGQDFDPYEFKPAP
jgi:hypothetical protein